MSKFIEPATAADYRELARRRLPRQIFDYLDGGSYQEWTRFNNESAFAAIRLRQRVLTDVSSIDLSCQRAGQPLLCPSRSARSGWVDGSTWRSAGHRAAASRASVFVHRRYPCAALKKLPGLIRNDRHGFSYI